MVKTASEPAAADAGFDAAPGPSVAATDFWRLRTASVAVRKRAYPWPQDRNRTPASAWPWLASKLIGLFA
jgi:hypothetical protein